MKKYLKLAVANKLAAGTTTSAGSSNVDVIDSGAGFVAAGVAAGDIVHNITDNSFHIVAAVTSATQLSLVSGSIGNAKAYAVYDAVDTTEQLIGLEGLALAQQASTSTVTLAYNAGGTGSDVVTITHQPLAGTYYTDVREAVEDAILDAATTKWTEGSSTITMPTGIKAVGIAIA